MLKIDKNPGGFIQAAQVRLHKAALTMDENYQNNPLQKTARFVIVLCLGVMAMNNEQINRMEKQDSIILFKEQKIRRTWHNNEWWFSVVDVVGALTKSSMARRYWSDLKRQLAEKEGFGQLYEKIVQLKLSSTDGKKYNTDCANTEFLLRIIQSVPSPKAEPFKLWLAKIGYERIQEIENPMNKKVTRRIGSISA